MSERNHSDVNQFIIAGFDKMQRSIEKLATSIETLTKHSIKSETLHKQQDQINDQTLKRLNSLDEKVAKVDKSTSRNVLYIEIGKVVFYSVMVIVLGVMIKDAL